MVFVPWRDLGICPFWAMHKTECKYGDACRWAHPPQEEVKRIWDWYTVQQSNGGEQLAGSGLDYGETLGVGPPRLEGYDGIPLMQTMPPSLTSTDPCGGHGTTRLPPSSAVRACGFANEFTKSPPRSLPPRYLGNGEYSFSDVAQQAPARQPSQPIRQGISRCTTGVGDQPDHSRPSSSGLVSIPPHLSNDGSYPPGFSSSLTPTSFQPSPHAYSTRPLSYLLQPEPQRRSPTYSAAPDEGLEGNQQREKPFVPVQSTNPFINGSLVYRFVWGDPLCVRCGYTGHLPKECPGEALTYLEQNYLYGLMREEQTRSKAEKGLETKSSTKQVLAPVPDPGIWDQLEAEDTFNKGASLLDVPVSPKEEGEVRHETMDWDRDGQQQTTVASYDGAGDMLDISARVLEQKRRSMMREDKDKVIKKKKSGRPDAKDPGRLKGTYSGELGQHLETTSTSSVIAPTPTASPAFAPSTLSLPPMMGATKRLSNGEAKSVGPHPSTMRVSAPYLTQSTVEKRLQPASLDPQERSQAEAREDSVRLQGVTWLDNVRRALQLPIKTFTTACVYYHKFRLAHAAVDYSWSDAAAASLLTSCKNEDTLKKSRDILAAAYNLKQPAAHEHVGADDPIFDAPSRVVIGLERLVLESGGFDFRSRSPHQALVKIGKSLPESEDLKRVSRLAWTILTDLHRTFAPLKQTSATLALASLELAVHFHAAKSEDGNCTVKDDLQALDFNKWHTTRDEVMETLLDALDLYTHNTASTILGTKYSLDDFLRIRLALNKECADSNLPRYTTVQPPPSPDNANGSSSTLRVTNGHPTPVSPPQTGVQAPQQTNSSAPGQLTPESGGTLRFMLDPQRAIDERAEVNRYYTEEWEEYEEEIEVPIPRDHSRDRHHRDRDGRPSHDERRGPHNDRAPQGPRRDRLRESLADREREAERERARLRDRERESRYDDRGHDHRPRERDRRYDDRGHRDRRHYDEDRRGGRGNRR